VCGDVLGRSDIQPPLTRQPAKLKKKL
jgi:hypothetical protein